MAIDEQHKQDMLAFIADEIETAGGTPTSDAVLAIIFDQWEIVSDPLQVARRDTQRKRRVLEARRQQRQDDIDAIDIELGQLPQR